LPFRRFWKQFLATLSLLPLPFKLSSITLSFCL
jgi:hypothetical protein